jgi:eukaryotic-like serine/threonine-protein kinase
VNDLNALLGHTVQQESASIRESYLQAAAFTGRDTEFNQLTLALSAAKEGKGSAWLIGGESGVGKSRLMDELRTHALVEGMLVLRGQAALEGGAPYQIWSDVLKLLSLQTDLSDLEASVLKTIVPDIESIIEHPVEDAPVLEGQNAQSRLHNMIEGLFRRQTQPILLMLEDLQWAGDALNIANHLTSFLTELPLMLVANYRDDEAPSLPQQLTGMQSIKLGRLNEAAIAELSSAMLGEVGQQAQVVDLLQRETEGNVFFLVEVVRALAEGAGSLNLIGQSTLPINVFAGGIRTVIQHRLNRIPAQHRPQLQFAATAGRGLDLALLRAAFPHIDLDEWLLLCSEANVIEVSDNAWRFSHDKLREFILAELPPGTQRQFHRQVAETLEQVYAAASQHAALVAYHWERALDPAQPDAALLMKAMNALEIAGEISLTTNAIKEALNFYTRLFALKEQYQRLKDALPIPNKRLAQWHFQLAEAQINLRDYPPARQHLETALSLVGSPTPRTKLAITLGILNQLRQQVLHRLFPQRYFGKASEQERENLSTAAAIERSLGGLYYILNEGLPSLFLSLHGLNMNERLGASPELARGYGMMTVLAGSFNMRDTADRYYQRALQVIERSNDPLTEAMVRFIASVHYSGEGQRQAVQADLERATAIFEQLGDAMQTGYSKLTYATSFFSAGDYDNAYRIYSEIDDTAQQKHILPHRTVANTFMARIDMIRGSADDARRKIDFALSLPLNAQDDAQLMFNPHAFAAWIYFHSEENARAYEQAERAFEIARVSNITSRWGHVGFATLLETYVGLWKRGDLTTVSRETLMAQAKKVFRALSMLHPPIAQPAVARSQALLAASQGQREAAIKHWKRSITAAQTSQIPYEEAVARLELSQHLTPNDPERESQRQAAHQLFERLKARYYLAILQNGTAPK